MSDRKRDGLGCCVLILAAGFLVAALRASERMHRAEDRLDKLESRAAWFCPPGKTHEGEVER